VNRALRAIVDRFRADEEPPPRPPAEPAYVVSAVIEVLEDHELVDACRRRGVTVRSRLAKALPGTPPAIVVGEVARVAHHRGLIDQREMHEVWAAAPLLPVEAAA
jgi:hypothetical protein